MEKILLNLNIRNNSFSDFNYFRDLMNGLNYGTYQVYVTKSPIRSVGLNAYYWGVIIHRISEHTGNDPNKVHEEMKKRFNPRSKFNKQGNSIVFGGSTKKENNQLFWIYCLRCILYALEELNIDIPYPNELNEDLDESDL